MGKKGRTGPEVGEVLILALACEDEERAKGWVEEHRVADSREETFGAEGVAWGWVAAVRARSSGGRRKGERKAHKR